MHIYFDLNAYNAFCNDYGITADRTRCCTSRYTCEVIPNVFLIWRDK